MYENEILKGTNSVCPPISGTIGINPALITSTVDIPNDLPGHGLRYNILPH